MHGAVARQLRLSILIRVFLSSPITPNLFNKRTSSASSRSSERARDKGLMEREQSRQQRQQQQQQQQQHSSSSAAAQHCSSIDLWRHHHFIIY
jgi:hypothetical protein